MTGTEAGIARLFIEGGFGAVLCVLFWQTLRRQQDAHRQTVDLLIGQVKAESEQRSKDANRFSDVVERTVGPLTTMVQRFDERLSAHIDIEREWQQQMTSALERVCGALLGHTAPAPPPTVPPPPGG